MTSKCVRVHVVCILCVCSCCMCTLYVHVCDHTVRNVCIYFVYTFVYTCMHTVCVQILCTLFVCSCCVCTWACTQCDARHVCTDCVCKCVCMLGVGAHSGGSSEVQGGLWWWGGEGLPGPVCVFPAESRGSAQAGPGRELPLGTWRQVDQLGLDLALGAGTTQTPRHGPLLLWRQRGQVLGGLSGPLVLPLGPVLSLRILCVVGP